MKNKRPAPALTEEELDAVAACERLKFLIEFEGSGFSRRWRISCRATGDRLATYWPSKGLCLVYGVGNSSFIEPHAGQLLNTLRLRLDLARPNLPN